MTFSVRSHGKDLRDLQDLSRDPAMSFLQKQAQPDAPRGPAAEAPTPFQKLKALMSGDALTWVKEYVRYRIGPRYPFPHYQNLREDNGVYPLSGDPPGGEAGSDEIRVALAGDWGTGTDEAFRIAELIERFAAHFTIHLGDVYFVGDPREVRENFLGEAVKGSRFTPCRWPSGTRGTFALNGNHEMYARGVAYFQMMLPNLGMTHAGKALGQKASFFCLENAHWRVIALDTGYNSIGIPILEYFQHPDCALPDATLDWLRDTLYQRTDRRAVVLLSHHQYCSRFDDCYRRPAEQMAAFIGRPVLWFWGHEHRLAVYHQFQTNPGISCFGRCIGHGGMPVELPGRVAHRDCHVELVDSRRYPNDENIEVGYNGFAKLRFNGDRLRVDYVDILDKVLFTETWQSGEDGTLRRLSFESSPGPA